MPERRARPEDLPALPVTSAERAPGRARAQVADIARTTGRFVIAHVGARRVQTVTANVRGRDAEGVHARRSRRGSGRRTVLPAGVYAEVGGTGTAQRAARRELLRDSLLAGAGIVMLLWVAFGESSRLLLVLANLPFALVGGVLAVFATGGLLSLGSLVGFVTLFGIATRNAVMLISHYDHLVAVEGAPWGRDAAIRGALERLGPDPDDRAGDRARPPAAGARQRRSRPRDRGSDGHRDPRRAAHVHRAQPVRAAATRASIRPVRSSGGGGVGTPQVGISAPAGSVASKTRPSHRSIAATSTAMPPSNTTTLGTIAHQPIPPRASGEQCHRKPAGTASATPSKAVYATIMSMFCPSASTPPGRPLPRWTQAGKSSAAPFWISMPR